MESAAGVADEHARKARERAGRLFDEAITELSDLIDLDPGHLDLLRRTDLLIASETRQIIREMLDDAEGGLYREEGGGRVVSTQSLEALDRHLRGDFSFLFTNNADCYSIVIGEHAEATSDDEYRGGLLAELAHAVVRTLGRFRAEGFSLDGSVSEFYDLAFSWQRKRATPKQLIALMRLSDFHVQNGHDREYVKSVARRAPKILRMLGVEEDNVLGEADVYRVLRSCKYRNQHHVGGASIAWRLANRITGCKQCSVRETLPYLTKVAGKTLYDPAVDFSSPEAFLETVSTRLDDYLAE